MTQNIADYVRRCLASFGRLLEPHSTTSRPQEKPLQPQTLALLSDEFSRFKVWTGTIGAHRTGPSSLDYRLRDASHIRDQVISLVRELLGMLDDVKAITTGEMTPWDELDEDEDEDEDEDDLNVDSEQGSPKTELEQLTADIMDVVGCLLRLSVDIKNPAPHQRFLDTKLTDKTYFEPYDIQHVSTKFHNMDPWLAERLGKSISRRRQYFKYRETHHEKLSAAVRQTTASKPSPLYWEALDSGARWHTEPKDYETIASSIPQAMKDNLISAMPRPAFIKDDQSEAGISHTSYATSAAASGNLKIPPLPKQADMGPFQCPFCYTMVVVEDRNAWKKHVYSDLRPYTCLVEDCISPDREFGRRHEWMEHVQQNHWHTYSCPFGCEADIKSIAECKAHLKVHQSSGSVQSGEMEAYVKFCQRPLDISAGIACPFCDETITSLKHYQRHVGRHQEQLFLFALPSADTENGSDEDQDSNMGSSRLSTVSYESINSLSHARSSNDGQRDYRTGLESPDDTPRSEIDGGKQERSTREQDETENPVEEENVAGQNRGAYLCSSGEGEGGARWRIMAGLPEMTICGGCYSSVVVPLQTEGGAEGGMANSFPNKAFRLHGIATCQLSTESRRAIFRLAAQNYDWDTLKRNVLEWRRQDQDRINREGDTPERQRLADDFEVARHRYEAINQRRLELLDPGESTLRTRAEIEAELIEASEREVQVSRVLREELERQGENVTLTWELDNLRFEDSKARQRREELEKEQCKEQEMEWNVIGVRGGQDRDEDIALGAGGGDH